MKAISGKTLLVGLAVLGLLGGLWLLTNFQPQSVGIIVFSFSIANLIVVLLQGMIGQALGDGLVTNNYGSINLGKSFLYGLGASVGVLILNAFTPLTVLIPVVSYSVANHVLAVTAEGLIAIFVAPIFEEVSFLFVIPFLVFGFIYGRSKNRFGSIALTMVVCSVLFAFYHYAAYGGTLLLSGAFIGAALFRFLTMLIVIIIGGTSGFQIRDVAPVIIVAMMMHMTLNAAVFTKALFVGGT